MALSDINPKLLEEKNKNGYEVLRDAIKKHKITKITKRDAVFLLNKQMEGVSETNGNLFIYMFYFSCTDPSGAVNSPVWYQKIQENDFNGKESTPWCACYASFILNMAGISPTGHWSSSLELFTKKHGLTTLTGNDAFNSVKSMDTVHYGNIGEGHVAFVTKENPNKKNNYKYAFYDFGGNQGDSVNLVPPQLKTGLAGFGTSPEYEKEINAGDFLSVLAYFVGANLKTPQERIELIKNRLDTPLKQPTTFSNEVYSTRGLINQNVNSNLSFATNAPPNNAYLLSNSPNTIPFRDRFKELLIFEQSLIDSGIPLTTNISGTQVASRAGSLK